MRDKMTAFDTLANRRREARKRQQEEVKRLQEKLDTMKLELGYQRRAVERQRTRTGGDPELLAAMEVELADAEAEFLRSRERVRRESERDGAASEEDTRRFEAARRDAAVRSRHSLFGRSFGSQHGYESSLHAALARVAAMPMTDYRWP